MAGQTISDRLLAARHSLAGQGLAKSVCKATTEEMIGPKKKHLDCKFPASPATFLITQRLAILSSHVLRPVSPPRSESFAPNVGTKEKYIFSLHHRRRLDNDLQVELVAHAGRGKSFAPFFIIIHQVCFSPGIFYLKKKVNSKRLRRKKTTSLSAYRNRKLGQFTAAAAANNRARN